MNLSVNGGLVRSNLSWSLSGARDVDRREEDNSSLVARHTAFSSELVQNMCSL